MELHQPINIPPQPVVQADKFMSCRIVVEYVAGKWSASAKLRYYAEDANGVKTFIPDTEAERLNYPLSLGSQDVIADGLAKFPELLAFFAAGEAAMTAMHRNVFVKRQQARVVQPMAELETLLASAMQQVLAAESAVMSATNGESLAADLSAAQAALYAATSEPMPQTLAVGLYAVRTDIADATTKADAILALIASKKSNCEDAIAAARRVLDAAIYPQSEPEPEQSPQEGGE